MRRHLKEKSRLRFKEAYFKISWASGGKKSQFQLIFSFLKKRKKKGGKKIYINIGFISDYEKKEAS